MSLVHDKVITQDDIFSSVDRIPNDNDSRNLAVFDILNMEFEGGNTLLQNPERTQESFFLSFITKKFGIDKTKALLTHANAKGEIPLRHAQGLLENHYLLENKDLLESFEPKHLKELYSGKTGRSNQIALYDVLQISFGIDSSDPTIKQRLNLHISLLEKLESKDLNTLFAELLDIPVDYDKNLYIRNETKLKYIIPLFAKLDSKLRIRIGEILLAEAELLEKDPTALTLLTPQEINELYTKVGLQKVIEQAIPHNNWNAPKTGIPAVKEAHVHALSKLNSTELAALLKPLFANPPKENAADILIFAMPLLVKLTGTDAYECLKQAGPELIHEYIRIVGDDAANKALSPIFEKLSSKQLAEILTLKKADGTTVMRALGERDLIPLMARKLDVGDIVEIYKPADKTALQVCSPPLKITTKR